VNDDAVVMEKVESTGWRCVWLQVGFHGGAAIKGQK
jgi:hypothetical protein